MRRSEDRPPAAARLPDRLRDLALTRDADIAHRFLSPAFTTALREWLTAQRFDLIQIENLEMAVYLPLIRELQPQARVVYDAHNAEYALQQRITRPSAPP